MPRAAHRPSQRAPILETVLTHLRTEGSLALSLDSAARAAGVSKPGLMYHFSSKEALVGALVDHLVDGYERELRTLLGATGPEEVSPRERIGAYARWALATDHDTADLVMLSDPKLWKPMSDRWSERLAPWLEIPDDTSAPERARLHAVRLLADGCWFADASGFLPVPREDRRELLTTALALLDGSDG